MKNEKESFKSFLLWCKSLKEHNLKQECLITKSMKSDAEFAYNSLHKGKQLSEKEVMENRSSAYEFVDFNKEETIEYDLLQHIKFCLECKNKSLAIRMIEQYGFVKQQEMNSVLDEYIRLLKSTTEFEVLDSFKAKVKKLENLKK